MIVRAISQSRSSTKSRRSRSRLSVKVHQTSPLVFPHNFLSPRMLRKTKKTSGSVTRPLERHVRPLFTNVLCRKASQNASNPDVDELRQRKTTSGSAPVGLSSDLRLRWTRDRDRKQTGQRKTRSSAGCCKNFNVPLKKNNNFVFCA